MAASISLSGLGCDSLYEIFSKKPQRSSKKDYSQAWETQPLAATISLSNFRGGSKLGFDAFCHKQDSSQYRKHGNCRMTRRCSYRWNIQPIVAKASSCPKILTTAMGIATNLISQPKLTDMVWIAGLMMPMSFILGMVRERTYDYATDSDTVVIEGSQVLYLIGAWTVMPKSTMLYTLGGVILGQALGTIYVQQQLSRLKRPNSVGGSDLA